MPVADDSPLARFRHRLHAAPELSERETQTAAAICERLAQCAPSEVLRGLGAMGTGVCAVFDSGEPGPVILLRAELDALPIRETNTFAHRSTVEGVSHKCGHDGHMATLIAVADALAASPIRRGKVYLLFQPAEETGTGALAVLADARFQALPQPDFVYGCHNVPKYPFGQVLLRTGLFAQASTGFRIVLTGTTSHASYPEHGVNPSSALTRIVDAVNGFDTTMAGQVAAPVLGTVTYARLGAQSAGPNFGTAPGEAHVTGVLRAHQTDDLDRLCAHLAELASDWAGEQDLGCELTWHERFAATRSHEASVALIRRAAASCGLVVHELDEPFRWSEDFGHFTDRYAGAFFGLGSGREQPQLHDDAYDFPDALIGIGARLYRALIDLHLVVAADQTAG